MMNDAWLVVGLDVARHNAPALARITRRRGNKWLVTVHEECGVTVDIRVNGATGQAYVFTDTPHRRGTCAEMTALYRSLRDAFQEWQEEDQRLARLRQYNDDRAQATARGMLQVYDRRMEGADA